MKILHVIDSGGFYGAEAMLVELALEQQKAGYDVTVCSVGTPSDTEKPLEKVCRERGVPVFPLRMKAGFNLFGGMAIVRYAKVHQFDLLHSHGYKGNILLGVLPKVIRVLPLITTLHGWTSTKTFSKIRLYEILDSILLNRMDAVVLVSNAMKQRKGIIDRTFKHCVVIENGIGEDTLDINPEDDIAASISSLSGVGPVIGSIGRLSYEKGYDILLSAFALVRQQVKGSKLVILGDGKLSNELSELASELGVEGDVWFGGYVEGANKYIGLFDVYVNSSRTEGTPITLLEAMRAETPIVAANVGGNSALIETGECGVVFDMPDTELLASNVCKVVLDADIRERIIKNAKRKFIEEHSSRKMMFSYNKLYKELI